MGVMKMKALFILVLVIGLVQAEQEEEQSKNIIRILFECTKNPDSSDLCWRLNEAFPNLEFPENHLNDPLGLDPPPQENLDLSTFVDEFEQRTKFQRKVWMKKPFIACTSSTKACLI